MPPKTLVQAGIVAFLLAVIVCSLSWYWFATRTFEPVNMPVKLEAEKNQAVEFSINLREEYSVRISADYGVDNGTEGKCADKLWQETDWKVYRLTGQSPNDKALWASAEEMRKQNLWPDGFHALRGRYELEWSVPASAVCLNAKHPRLGVWTDPGPYETALGFVLLACIAMVMGGFGALLRAVVVWFSGVLQGRWVPRILPDMAITSVIPLRRHRPMPLIRVLPDFRTAWFCVIGVLTVLFCLFLSSWNWRPTGLPVDFKLERGVAVEKSPWAETMAVYVDAKRGFFVNGKPAAREELRSKLQEELLRRGVWTVYFEADGNCLYEDAVYVMDTIQGLGAKVIWITPKTREEWKKSGAPTSSNRANRVP